MIVVDASIVTDFLLGRPDTVRAVTEHMAGNDHQPLHAPDLVELEALNALRRLARGGQVTDDRASEAAEDLADLRLVRYPHAPLRPRIWELRHNLTAYDAAYLALAEALDDPVLLTSDRDLAEQASASLGADRVRHVG